MNKNFKGVNMNREAEVNIYNKEGALGRLVAINSVRAGVGKTFITTFLATSLSSKNLKSNEVTLSSERLNSFNVCIVEADFWKDTSSIFKNDSLKEPKFRFEENYNSFIRDNLFYNEVLDLHILKNFKTSKSIDRTSKDFMSIYTEVIKELREIFDLVIFDTDINYVSEINSHLILHESDAILLVIDKTPINEIQSLYRWITYLSKEVKEKEYLLDLNKVHVVLNKEKENEDYGKALASALNLKFIGSIPEQLSAFKNVKNSRGFVEALKSEPEFSIVYENISKKLLEFLKTSM